MIFLFLFVYISLLYICSSVRRLFLNFFLITGARGLPSSLCNDVEARWIFWDQKKTCTKPIKGPTIAPDFEHISHISIDVDREFVQYVQNDSLEVEIWGKPTQKGFNGKVTKVKGSGINQIPKTVPELQAALEEERSKRKVAENRIAELTDEGTNSSVLEVDALRNEVEMLKKKLSEQKSGVCVVS